MFWWQALLLGVVEGVTEYLPISSTGHLILTAWLLGFSDDPERWAAAFTFNIVIQSGAIAAVLFLYRVRIARMAVGLLGRDDEGRRLAVHLAIAFLPAAILGPLLDDVIEARLNGPWPVALALFAGAVLMLAVARRRRGGDAGRDLEAIDWRIALWIGCGQCVAMWPGTSRSMMTIVVALLAGLRPTAAAEFSFLLGLITLSAATGYKLLRGGPEMLGHFGISAFLIGFAAATVAAALAVKWFVAFLNRRGLAPFAWYRLVIAVALAAAILGGWLRVPSDDGNRPYRDAACEAARWLRSVAVETDDGRIWPVDPDGDGDRVDHLYHGNAGVVLYFVTLARATGEAGYLEDARRGADHLLASLPEELGPYEAALYTGVAGIGYVLDQVARATGEERYREGVERVVRLLRREAVPAAGGVEWPPSTDIVGGSAGIGLFLLDAGRALDDPEATALAAAAGRRLLGLAEPTEDGGRRWPMEPEYPRIMPNFSHGTAGVAYFLASLYLETGEEAFLEAALAGARHLLAIAETRSTSCRIHHHTPGGEELFYLGWCHGPAGTGRLFYRLYQATGDEEWLDWLRRFAGAVAESGIPEDGTPGFWNNVGQCCGSAGVVEFLLGVDRVLGEESRRPLARRLADDVLDRATRTADGLKWIQAEHRVRPELLVAQTGYMQGAAGVGMMLLRLDGAEQGRPLTGALPDSPF